MKKQAHKHVYLVELSSGNHVRITFEDLEQSNSYDIEWLRARSFGDIQEYHRVKPKIVADLNRLGFRFKRMVDPNDRGVSARMPAENSVP